MPRPGRPPASGPAGPARVRRLLAFLLAVPLALVLLAAPAPAQDAIPVELIEEALAGFDRDATRIEQRLSEGDIADAELEELRTAIAAQRLAVPDRLAQLQARVAPLVAQLDALGPAPAEGETEAETVARERAALRSRIDELTALDRRLRQADARAAGIVGRLADERRRLFNERLQSRGPSIFDPDLLTEGIAEILAKFATIGGETLERLRRPAEMETLGSLALLVLAFAAPLALLHFVRRSIAAWLLGRITPDMPASSRVAVGFGLTLLRLFIPSAITLLVLFGLLNTGLLGPEGQAMLVGIVRTLLVVIGAYALGSAFFSPAIPELRLSRLDDPSARRAQRWLMSLAAVIGLDAILIESATGVSLPLEAVSLLNVVLITLGSIALWRLVSVVWRGTVRPTTATVEEGEEEDSSVRFTLAILPLLLGLERAILLLIAVVAPLLAASGYFAASRFVFYTPVFTAALIAFLVLLFLVVREVVVDVLVPAEGERGRASRLRLVPVAVGFLLSVLAIPLIALIWGARWADLLSAWRSIASGFQVGEITVSPVDFGAFLMVFGIGWLLTRVTQGVVSRSVLPLTGLDSGGRAAVLAGIGYLGIFLAALVAVATIGLDLSNLAIVAGALSVGIGFGLQAIVSNFVSGIILLVERPIKAGDWVELPSGTGYVKRVNVRSTEIETFDRATLFVPNSELIANTVTNWTHSNLHGRVIVPVHVAYGTDPRRVEAILLEIAKAHPMMLRKPAPFVLLRGFADGAYRFEIRGILRDVNWIFNVHSDLNFEIVRRFGEEGITIPLPQSELSFRNPGEVARSVAGALGRAGADTTPDGAGPAPGTAGDLRRRAPGGMHDADTPSDSPGPRNGPDADADGGADGGDGGDGGGGGGPR